MTPRQLVIWPYQSGSSFCADELDIARSPTRKLAYNSAVLQLDERYALMRQQRTVCAICAVDPQN